MPVNPANFTIAPPGSYAGQPGGDATTGGLMSIFGKTPEEQVKALKDLSQILSGMSQMTAGLTKNGLGDRFAQVIQRQMQQTPEVEIPDRAALAAQMIIDMGFGRY